MRNYFSGGQCVFPNSSDTNVTYFPVGCNEMFSPTECLALYTCEDSAVTSSCNCSNGVTMNCSETERFIDSCIDTGNMCQFPNQSATTVTYFPEGCNELFSPTECQAEYACAGTQVTSTCQCSKGVLMNCSATERFIGDCRGK